MSTRGWASRIRRFTSGLRLGGVAGATAPADRGRRHGLIVAGCVAPDGGGDFSRRGAIATTFVDRGGCAKPLAEKLERLVSAPAVSAFEQVQLEAFARAGGVVNLLDLAEAAHRRVQFEAFIVRPDLDQQRARRD